MLPRPRTNENFAEQGVAGYDPQVIAWHQLPLAAIFTGMARGSSPEP